MSTQEIAKDLAALCRNGKFAEAGEKYWADDVISVEFGGPEPVSKGKDAVRAKSEWFAASHDIHRLDAGEPYLNGDQFVIRFTLDMTVKESGQRMTMDEVGLYTVRDGKVVEERFFFAG
jgi:ketosteroid isomerase-like protein